MDRAGHHAADQNPQRARKVAELRGQNRAKQRAGRGDRGEVMPEQNIFVRLDVVVTVVDRNGRCDAVLVQFHHLVGEKQTIEAVCNRKNACRHEDQC